MARYLGPVCRMCRREGLKLFLKGERCYTDKCAIERRNYPPLDVTGFLGFVAQRAAQFPDVSSQQFIAYAGAGPDAREQFPFGHQPLSILHEVVQNVKCLRAQVHQVRIAPKLFVRGVQPKRWEYKNSPRCHCVPNGPRRPVLILTEVPRNLHGPSMD